MAILTLNYNQVLMFSSYKTDMTISYLSARVIHSNKYNQNSGFYFLHFFFSSLFHDIVFKTDNGDEYPMTLKNLNLPIYQGQSVTLIMIDGIIISFIDNSTNNYYYLTKNIQEGLGKGLKINWIIPVGVALLLSTIFLPNYFSRPLFIILFFIPIAYWFYLKISNSFFERKIDKLITKTYNTDQQPFSKKRAGIT